MKLAAIIIKELKLLIRDRAGMALLFVMPAFLVIAITLIQEKVTTTTVDVLLVDEDQQELGLAVRDLLGEIDAINLIESIGGKPVSAQLAQELVAAGKYQFGVVLPENLSAEVKSAAYARVAANLLKKEEIPESETVPEILVWFDPTVHGSFRAAVKTALNQVVASIQTQLYVADTLQIMMTQSTGSLPAIPVDQLGMSAPEPRELLPHLYEKKLLIPIREQFSSAMGFIVQPSAVQQNVPAWAIFGIFFICVPLAGATINERRSGTFQRLRTLPIHHGLLICGKLAAFALVCGVQFLMIVLAGIYVLPLIGLPAFDPGSAPLLLGVVLSGVVVAACGYGILLGTVGRTYEQVAVFAPVSVVIGAAVGGVMVPVYAMPQFMRSVAVISPLYWGQSGFYDVLLRGGSLVSVLPETGALLLFGCTAIMISLLWQRRWPGK